MNRAEPSDPERQAAAGELRVVLEWAIDRLADGAREVFVLREVEGMSTAEVAAALDVSDDVVKTRLSRARAAIRRDLIARTGSSASEVFRFYKPRCDRVVARCSRGSRALGFLAHARKFPTQPTSVYQLPALRNPGMTARALRRR